MSKDTRDRDDPVRIHLARSRAAGVAMRRSGAKVVQGLHQAAAELRRASASRNQRA